MNIIIGIIIAGAVGFFVWKKFSSKTNSQTGDKGKDLHNTDLD